MSSRKDILLHRQFYLLRAIQLSILLFCVAGFLYSSLKSQFSDWIQLTVILGVCIASILFWIKKEWLLLILTVTSVLINLGYEFGPFWTTVRVFILVILCLANIFSMELRYANSNFSLTLFPPGTGTLRPHAVGNVGRFLSLWELATSLKWTNGGIFIGRPLPEQRLIGLFNFVKVGPKDDRHMLTIAAARSGKGSAVIIPNLIHYPGSVIAIDPKGELANITASRRGKGSDKVPKYLGQRVFVFDPENIVKNHNGCCWNPLGELELSDPSLWTKIVRISSVIIPLNDDPNASFFTSQARTLLTAIIAHVLELESPERRNLIHVRKLVMEGDIEYFNMLTNEGNNVSDPQEALLVLMSQNSAHGGKVARAASSFRIKAMETKTSILGTLEENTDFLDDPGLERYLQSSDLELSQLKREPTTLYICIDATSLSTPLVKILSIFVDLAIVALAKDITEQPKNKVLFLLDEFPALGRLESIEKGMGLIAGYGITLWPIIQNIGQLKSLYPNSYTTFLTNTRGIQFFGELEEDNYKYIEERCGKKIQRFPDGSTQELPLLSASYLKTDFFVRSDRRQIYLPQGRPAALLELVDYYKFISKDLYNSALDVELPRQEVGLLPHTTLDNLNSDNSFNRGITEHTVVETREMLEGHEEIAAEHLETGFILKVDHMRTFRLTQNLELTIEDLPELNSSYSGGVVATVVKHPIKESVFGIKNQSNSSWFLSTENGTNSVETGKSITLSNAIKFNIGTIDCEIFERPFLLVLSDERIIVLNEGRIITDRDICQLTSISTHSTVVAKVVVNPRNNDVLGLQNLSLDVWHTTNLEGKKSQVGRNKSITLKPGVMIEFGGLGGQIIL